MEGLVAFVAGGSVFLFLAYIVRARALRPAESRLRRLSASSSIGIDHGSGDRPLLRRSAARTPVLSRLLSSGGYGDRWRRDLERAELKLRTSEYLFIRLLVGFLGALVLMVVFQNGGSFLLGVAAGVGGFMLPALWVRHLGRRRLSKINDQLVETITLIANSLRAGFALAQGIEVAAKRVGPPMSVELGRLLLDVSLGATIEDALTAMNSRVDSDDLDMVVTGILIQRATGGNLAEVLDNVTETMRERERINGEIRTFTSQQRLTGWILTLWPVVLALVFFAINPSLTSLMWTTGIGQFLLIIWVGLTLAAAFTYRRILAIDV